MREFVVLSGKGGTGKTSVTSAFATLARRPVLVDCDVDAADLHLILEPQVRETHEFTGGQVAAIDPAKCANCGACADTCRFEAISFSPEESCYAVDGSACEGCGVCVQVCPFGAAEMRDTLNGHWFISQTRVGPMLHARLRPGGENSGKLVSLIRDRARQLAKESESDLIITDGPPGIGCPVIASLAGASRVVVVTEPTVSGIHDLRRVADLAAHFNVPASIIINKCDINPEKAAEIAEFASSGAIDLLGSIPYDPIVTKAQLAGLSVTEYSDSPTADLLREIWDRLTNQTTYKERQ